jgi:hypothetical protein
MSPFMMSGTILSLHCKSTPSSGPVAKTYQHACEKGGKKKVGLVLAWTNNGRSIRLNMDFCSDVLEAE